MSIKEETDTAGGVASNSHQCDRWRVEGGGVGNREWGHFEMVIWPLCCTEILKGKGFAHGANRSHTRAYIRREKCTKCCGSKMGMAIVFGSVL